MGCPIEVNGIGFGCKDISMVGAGGQGVVYPGTWAECS